MNDFTFTRAYMLWLFQAFTVALSQLPPPSSTLPSPMSSCRFWQNPAECQYSRWNSYGLIAVDSEWNFIILMDSHVIPIESIRLLQIQQVKYRGLYSAPLIPAGIQSFLWNLVDSRGIIFGRKACYFHHSSA